MQISEIKNVRKSASEHQKKKKKNDLENNNSIKTEKFPERFPISLPSFFLIYGSPNSLWFMLTFDLFKCFSQFLMALCLKHFSSFYFYKLQKVKLLNHFVISLFEHYLLLFYFLSRFYIMKYKKKLNLIYIVTKNIL